MVLRPSPHSHNKQQFESANKSPLMFKIIETMMYVREKPWHGWDTRVEEALASADVLRMARKGYSGLQVTPDLLQTQSGQLLCKHMEKQGQLAKANLLVEMEVKGEAAFWFQFVSSF